jgi:hypothetical protein
VPPGDPAALAGAVRRLRDDGGFSAGLGRLGREFAERNAREVGVDKLDALIKSIAPPG